MRRITGSFKRNFIAGLLVTAPFGLTIYVLYIVGKWLVGLVSAAPAKILTGPLSQLPPHLFQIITFAIGFIGTVLIVLLVGAIARNFVGGKIVGFGEGLISRIPFARTVYTAIKQTVDAIFGEGLKGLKRVVMFEYPRKGAYSIGFVTAVYNYGESDKKLLGIFLPTAFNPTGGFYVLLPEDEVQELPISVEEAFKIIVSGGLASDKIENLKFSPENDKKV